MPNSQNRSNGKSGIVQPKRRATKAAPQNEGGEQSGAKQGVSTKGKKGGSGRSSGGGRDDTRSGNPND